ncbi:MAG TPA: NAD(P)H-dependent glycerol-3-phosphate dehydrogenase [bacterium]
MNLAVLSAGTWGISLAALLRGKGHDVRVWEYAPAVVEELARTRKHPKLPGFQVPPDVVLTTNIARAIQGVEGIVFVPPAAHLRETAKRVAEAGYRGQPCVICSKGIEQGTHALPVEVLLEELGAAAKGKVGILSGPSHAEEVSRGMPTVVTAAATDLALAEWIRDLFMTPRFRVYTQTDVVGVELAAALKNVIAISCGVSDGLGFGDNAKAGLITRGLQEILRLGVARGAKPDTFFGLAGIGDLVVTCMSRHSRNWKYGSLLGAGTPPEQALAQVGMVVEGYYTVRAAVELAAESKVEMPITREVANVIFHGKSALEAVSALMLRDPKQE